MVDFLNMEYNSRELFEKGTSKTWVPVTEIPEFGNSKSDRYIPTFTVTALQKGKVLTQPENKPQ